MFVAIFTDYGNWREESFVHGPFDTEADAHAYAQARGAQDAEDAMREDGDEEYLVRQVLTDTPMLWRATLENGLTINVPAPTRTAAWAEAGRMALANDTLVRYVDLKPLNPDGTVRCEYCDGDGEGDHGPCPDCGGEGIL